MAKSLSHTRYNCKYHIIFIPKYRRKVIYNKLRKDIQKYIVDLCKWKGVEIIEGHLMPDHVHLLVEIPPWISISNFMGYLKGKSSLMIFELFKFISYTYIECILFYWSRLNFTNVFIFILAFLSLTFKLNLNSFVLFHLLLDNHFLLDLSFFLNNYLILYYFTSYLVLLVKDSLNEMVLSIPL